MALCLRHSWRSPASLSLSHCPPRRTVQGQAIQHLGPLFLEPPAAERVGHSAQSALPGGGFSFCLVLLA